MRSIDVSPDLFPHISYRKIPIRRETPIDLGLREQCFGYLNEG